MIIVSFFTPDYEDQYAGWIQAIIASGCGYECYAREVADRGSWRANCGLKPHFLLGCLEQFDESVLWVDIDARVRGRLETDVDLAHFDFGAWFMPAAHVPAKHRPAGNAELDGILSGTLYCNNTQPARELLQRWIKHDHGQHDWEQTVLGEVWHLNRPRALTTLELSQSWCKIYDAPWLPGEEGPVQIEHYQASRTKKKKAKVRS